MDNLTEAFAHRMIPMWQVLLILGIVCVIFVYESHKSRKSRGKGDTAVIRKHVLLREVSDVVTDYVENQVYGNKWTDKDRRFVYDTLASLGIKDMQKREKAKPAWYLIWKIKLRRKTADQTPLPFPDAVAEQSTVRHMTLDQVLKTMKGN